MKKIFLIPMMAMICTISAWGVNVAKIGSTEYETVTAAIEAVPDGVETQIDLIANSIAAQHIVIPQEKDIILNLNSYSLSSTYTDGQDGWEENSVIYNKGKLHVISNGKGIIHQTTEGGDAAVFCNESTGDLTIDGGIFLGKHVALMGYLHFNTPIIWTNGGSVKINGGTFLRAKGAMYIDEWDTPLLGPANWTIHGGIFSDDVTSIITEADKALYVCTQVPYKNANVTGYTSNTNVYVVRPVATVESLAEAGADDAVQISGSQSVSGNQAAKFVYIEPASSLTIPANSKFHVGEGGIVMGGTDSRLIVEAGATLLSDGDIVTSADENVQLTMDARSNKYSVLALKANNIQAKHPNATVTLKSVNKSLGGDSYQWQRFAIPTYQTNLTRSIIATDPTDGHTFGTALYRWDYNSAAENKWTSVGDAETLNPFECYIMTINTPEDANYIFKCELVGNGNPTIALHNDWNFLANSYTAPIQLGAVLNSMRNDADHILTQGVWVQETPTSTEWASVTYADVLFDDMITEKLNPMQAFVFHKPAGAANSIEIDYENYVSKPLFPSAQGAPARHQGVAEDITRAHIIVADENGDEETVKLYLSDDFSAAEDEGFDLPKFINEGVFNFYAVTDLGNLERVASNNLDEIALVLETKDATSFTMKFDKVTLEGYAIRDNLTEEVISITAENEYAFTAEDNATIADRFVVVKQTPTAIDNTEAASAKKGIYSLTGVYMGENFHVLPAGVYIMNGKKVVK